MEANTCCDCGAQEGHLHDFGCDMERCPFCGWQLISCDCCYRELKLFDKNGQLPAELYLHGLNDDQTKKWEEMLTIKGRYPYIRYPVLCAYCGKLWPDFFMVSPSEWKHFIQPDMRNQVLCRSCYDRIVKLTNDGVQARNERMAKMERNGGHEL